MNSRIDCKSALLRLACGLPLAAWLAVLAGPCGAAEDQTIVPPPGDYKMVEVVLEKGHPQEGDLTLRGGIRDGKLVIPDSTSVRLKAGEHGPLSSFAASMASTATTCGRRIELPFNRSHLDNDSASG